MVRQHGEYQMWQLEQKVEKLSKFNFVGAGLGLFITALSTATPQGKSWIAVGATCFFALLVVICQMWAKQIRKRRRAATRRLG